MEIVIMVNQLPPIEYSPNARVHWAARWQAGKNYSEAVYLEAVSARNKVDWQALEYARMELEFVFAQERIRDADNHRARFKPGQDALVQAGIISYDDINHLHCYRLTFRVDKDKAPMTIITITGENDV